MSNESLIFKYDTYWPAHATNLDIEFSAIRKNGYWDYKNKRCGQGLFHHYRAAQSLLWPKEDHHRWSDLTLKTMIENDISVLMGCSDSSKTNTMSKFILVDYWAFPDDTLWLVSSTDYRGAELRIWGRIKKLFTQARREYPNLAGRVIDSKFTITTESLDDKGVDARSLTRGLILVPMKKGGTKVGLSSFLGIKSNRLRHAGDEVPLCPPEFLDAYSNWYGKEDFKGIMAGNPLDITDPLCTAAEPVEGWASWVDTSKTQTWRSRWFNAAVVALDGRDSPNFEFPSVNGKPRFHYLIGEKKLKAVADTYGENSWQYYQQCIGKPTPGASVWRVVTRAICEQHRAFEEVVWGAESPKRLYAIDPAFGGDRCVGLTIDFGFDVNGVQILKPGEPEIIPIRVGGLLEPEDQIAQYVFNRLRDLNIDPSNCFYDSVGRGTLGFAFARVFGHKCPVPVDSGAKPTKRPVRYDLHVQEADGSKRLKRSDEHYSKFITEMWFSIREIIESDQMRELNGKIVEELSMRMYRIVMGNRIEVETKADLKERLKRSPDLADCLAIGCEGARQRGFRIIRSGEKAQQAKKADDWLDKQAEEYAELLQSRQLTSVR